MDDPISRSLSLGVPQIYPQEGNDWGLMFSRQEEVCLRISSSDDPEILKIPDKIFKAVDEHDMRPLMSQIHYNGETTERNYNDLIKILLMVELARRSVEMRRFDMLGAKQGTIMLLVGDQNDQFLKPTYGLRLPDLEVAEQIASTSELVLLTTQNLQVISRIKRIEGGIVELSGDLSKFLSSASKLDIYFLLSKETYNACETALKFIDSMRDVIFENTDPCGIYRRVNTIQDYVKGLCGVPDLVSLGEHNEADERLAWLNPEQQQVVRGILEAKCRPQPYILLAQPGFGKTRTLTETIAQVYLRDKKLAVLFCCSSSARADRIYDKLNDTDLFLDLHLVRHKRGDIVPASARVVVTTNIESECLIRRQVFDIVFIDGAGDVHEAEALVPICTLSDRGCLVLAGHPSQSQPILNYDFGTPKKPSSSLLERLLKFRAYQPEPKTDGLDPWYITKLVKCTRWDRRIMQLHMKLTDDMEFTNNAPSSIMAIMHLSSSVQFLPVSRGPEHPQQDMGPCVNAEEMLRCVDLVIRFYKLGFEPDQIGIMTPYEQQVEEIKKGLDRKLSVISRMLDERFAIIISRVKSEVSGQCLIKKNNWSCKIDTVKNFKGDTREVIIYSHVRSNSNGRIDFSHNDDCNYDDVVSRAKWLLLVVGNAEVMRCSKKWSDLITTAERDLEHLPPQYMSEDPFGICRPLFSNSWSQL